MLNRVFAAAFYVTTGIVILAAALYWSTFAALGQTTVRLFDGLGIARANQISRMDVNGDHINATDSSLFYQFPGDPYIYWYTSTSDRGFLYTWAVGNWGGVAVYKSLDMVQWTPAGESNGFVFDASGAAFQNLCTGPISGGFYQACWPGSMLRNASTGKFMLWFGNNFNAYTLTCDRPTGGCTTTPVQASTCNGGGNFYGPTPFIDNSGNGWIWFVNRSGNATTQALNSTYTDCAGSAHDTGVNAIEGGSLFQNGSTYYLIAGPGCAYCGQGAFTYYWTFSTDPLSTISSATRIDQFNFSCAGQAIGVSKLNFSGTDYWLYDVMEWNGGSAGTSPSYGVANQNLSNHFWTLLSFSGSVINSFPCSTTITFPGLTPQPPPILAVDQTSENAPSNTICDVFGTHWDYQTFTSGRDGPLSSVWVVAAPGNDSCILNVSGGTCPSATGPDADLSVTVVNDSGGTPGATLATLTIPRAGLSWNPKRVKLPVSGVLVSAGQHYGLVLSSPGTTVGCWVTQYGDLTPYAGGQKYTSTNSGGSWTPVANTSIMFSTVAGGGGGGRTRGR